jgi:hypothetical protein
MPEPKAPIVRQLGAMLHTYFDNVAAEPLPTRWVDLIHALNERERARSQRRDREQPSERSGD